MRSVPIRLLKLGRTRYTSKRAIAPADNEIIHDSMMNWLIRLPLRDPITFLIPTSRALSADRAVVRLMKLMLLTRIITAMARRTMMLL